MNITETMEPTEIEQKQAELKAAWEALQAVPSYVEQQAAKFASEKEVKESMKTYYIHFKVKGRQQECLAFIARSLDNAIAYLRHIYEGTRIVILYVVCDNMRTEIEGA